MKRTWYLAAVVPLAIGVVIAVLAFSRLVSTIEGMPRMVAPGDTSFTLPAGDHVVYAESTSVVDGVAYANDGFSVSCALTAADGERIELSAHGGKLTYTLGGYSGRAIFDFTLARPGPVTLACKTDEGKAVLAVGTSFATTIVAAVVPLVLGVLGAVGTFAIIYTRRKRYLALVAARDNTH